MAFNVTYSFNNGAVTGTATSITALRTAIYNYAHSGNVSSSTGSDYSHLTQCTLSGTAEGELTSNEAGTSTGTNYGIFYNCTALTSVDLSNLNTSNVTSMAVMFGTCSSLTSLDLSNFDTRNVTSMQSMFNTCSSLTSIKTNKLSWNTSKVTSSSNMFNGCTHLPNYNSSYVDKTKAIDQSQGGYLTMIVKPILKGIYNYYEHYSDGVKVIPKSKDMFEFVTQEVFDLINHDKDMLYFIIE